MANIFDMSDAWNDGGTTFTAIKMDVTDTSSASDSLLMDLKVGGTSQFKVRKNGLVTSLSYFGGLGIRDDDSYYAIGQAWSGVRLSSSYFIAWGSSSAGSVADLFLTRKTGANLRLGAADAAGPVAQTLSVQSVVAGTTNTVGQNFTIQGSAGTGSGAGGSIIFQVAPASGSGTGQNSFIDGLTINSTGDTSTNTISVNTVGTNVPQGGGLGSIATSLLAMRLGTAWTFATGTDRFVLPTSSWLGFSSLAGTNDNMGSSPNVDTRLYRDAANTLALRNGANAQTFRVYNTYDGVDDEWLSIDFSTTTDVASIRTTKNGAGTARAIDIQSGTARKISFPTIGGWELLNGATREGYLNWDAFTVRSDSKIGFASSTTVSQGAGDTTFVRSAAGVMGVRAGAAANGGSLEFLEQTAPAAGGATSARIFAQDNGSGKTQLMVQFGSGAAQQIAIEP